MPHAYPGYVYHPYPKMLYDKSFGPLGYKIVKSEEEEINVKKTITQDPLPPAGDSSNMERPVLQKIKICRGRRKRKDSIDGLDSNITGVTHGE